MIKLVGLRKNIDIQIREKLAINSKKQDMYRENLLEFFEEVVILSTCNRTEIYLNTSLSSEEILEKVFKVFNWDRSLEKYCFCLEEEKTVKHLIEVICGFHSRILGEDQILGQIKDAYQNSLDSGAVKKELQRLFQDAITCGKRFRTESKLYQIPVSSASIAVNHAITKGVKKIMLLGYGEVGKLVTKYALSHNIEELNIVVRNINSINNMEDNRINIMDYAQAREIMNNMECIIACTAAPHVVVEKKYIPEVGDDILIFDLAVPRDVDEELSKYSRVTLLDIDDISEMDDENKKLRTDRMAYFKYIPDQYIKEFFEWKNLRGVSEYIKEFKAFGNDIVEDRYKSFFHKCKDSKDIELAKVLIKSTSDTYVNRAIQVLKEETLKGSEEECLRILKKLFQMEK